MVFFTCSHCGGSIKKPSVAKHYQTTCKNLTPFVTCVDCLKDFKGNEYEAHTKCFTEEERYSAKGFVPKASANKGEKKQKAWSDCVQGLLSSGSLQQDEKNLLGAICKYDNIPRKKVKFVNFLNSTARSFADKTELIDRVWNKMENYFKEANSASQKDSEANGESGKTKRKQDEIVENNENVEGKKAKKKKHSVEETKNGDNAENGDKAGENEKKKKKRKKEEVKEEINRENEPKSKKAKKLKMNGEENAHEKKKNNEQEKLTENNNAEGEDGRTEDNNFNWTDAVMKVLSEGGSKNQIKVGKLQKKVLKKYREANGCEIDDKIIKKFSKKLNKIDSVVVNGDYVSLKS